MYKMCANIRANLAFFCFYFVLREIRTSAVTTFFLNLHCMNFLMRTSSAPEIILNLKLTAWFTWIDCWSYITLICTKFFSEPFPFFEREYKKNKAKTKVPFISGSNFPGFVSHCLKTSLSGQVRWRGFEKRTLKQSQQWWVYCFSLPYQKTINSGCIDVHCTKFSKLTFNHWY